MRFTAVIEQTIRFVGAIKAVILSNATDKPDRIGNIILIKAEWENRIAKQLKIKINSEFTAKIHINIKFIIPYNYIYTIYIPVNTQIRADIKSIITIPIKAPIKIKVPLARGIKFSINGRVKKLLYTRAWWYGYSSNYNDLYHAYYNITFSFSR